MTRLKEIALNLPVVYLTLPKRLNKMRLHKLYLDALRLLPGESKSIFKIQQPDDNLSLDLIPSLPGSLSGASVVPLNSGCFSGIVHPVFWFNDLTNYRSLFGLKYSRNRKHWRRPIRFRKW